MVGISILDWFNRLGLVLGLISTILLSPQLIGLERLKHLEKIIKLKVISIEGLSFYHQTPLRIFIRSNKSLVNKSLQILVVQLITLTLVFFNPDNRQENLQLLLSILPYAVAFVGLFVGIPMSKAYPGTSKLWSFSKWSLLGAFLFTFAIPIIIIFLIFTIIIRLFIMVLSLTRMAMEWINRKLEGEWLLGFITTLGVLFLFISFLFQFVATFK